MSTETQHEAHPAEHTLTVKAIRHLTPNAVQYVFEDPPSPLSYKAGQFLTFHIEVGGKVYQRSYSLVGSPHCGDPLSIVVKRVQGGVVSAHLHSSAVAGLTFSVSAPVGRFCITPQTKPRFVILIGGGSGITPLFAIAKEILATEPESKVSLLYCNVSPDEIILRAELEQLVRESGGRLFIQHVLEQGAGELGALSGRLDRERASAILGDLGQGAAAEYYLCGPEGLMEIVHQALVERKVPADVIKQEHFVPPPPPKTGTDAELILHIGKKEHHLRVRANESLLDAALSANIVVESSCRVGDCGTCKLRLVSGDVTQTSVEGLTPDEERSGYILSCVSFPRSPKIVVSMG